MFALLYTDTLLRVAPTSFDPVSASTETEICNWARDIYSYAEAHQVSVPMFRGNQHKPSEAPSDTWVRQAAPARFKGHTTFILDCRGWHQ